MKKLILSLLLLTSLASHSAPLTYKQFFDNPSQYALYLKGFEQGVTLSQVRTVYRQLGDRLYSTSDDKDLSNKDFEDIDKNTLECVLYFIDKYNREKNPENLSFLSLFIEKFYNELCLNDHLNLNTYFFNQSKILSTIDEMKKFNLDEKNISIWIKDILQNEAK